jgi:hypothetical protein
LSKTINQNLKDMYKYVSYMIQRWAWVSDYWVEPSGKQTVIIGKGNNIDGIKMIRRPFPFFFAVQLVCAIDILIDGKIARF